jgi:uncharacterized RDD family membrane protein YckC
VQIEDRVTISTPEGVDLELTLAGVGSRFTSAIVDSLIQGAIIVALLVLFLGVGDLGGGVAQAVFTVVGFALFAGYDITFEVLASGRTPGKRLNGLRVVRTDGSPVTFLTSAVRNLLRIVDIVGLYAVGIISILVTSKNQRLGDLAAGTLVVRERRAVSAAPAYSRSRAGAALTAPPPGATAPWSAWDVSGVTTDELVAVRRFLDRRHDLTLDARGLLASELATALLPKVVGVPEQTRGETFLEQLAAAKAQRG